jgi:hypothetical protein
VLHVWAHAPAQPAPGASGGIALVSLAALEASAFVPASPARSRDVDPPSPPLVAVIV